MGVTRDSVQEELVDFFQLLLPTQLHSQPSITGSLSLYSRWCSASHRGSGSRESWCEGGKPAVPVHPTSQSHKAWFSHYLRAGRELLLYCASSGRAGYLRHWRPLDDFFLIDLSNLFFEPVLLLVERDAEDHTGDEETSADLATGTHAPAFINALCRT